MPAFRILTNRTLTELAAARPRDEAALLAVRGIGPTVARKYGATLLELLARGSSPATEPIEPAAPRRPPLRPLS